jgi:quercetin dioxygenase-like cupin family protein
MLIRRKEAKTSCPVPGITRSILAYTNNVMITEHALEKDAVLPEHKHPHEQIVYLLSGEIILEINTERLKLLPGDSVSIPTDVKHKAAAVKESIALDIFAPARLDYL